jgi:spectinomycin phosphotransferase
MSEPPKISNGTLQAVLDSYYGLPNTALNFLSIGNDSASYVYQVSTTDGKEYFLKIRTKQGFGAPSLLIPHFLAEQDIHYILFPIPTIAQELWIHVHDFVVTVYPFLDARTATEAGLSAQQWHALGEALHQIHRVELPAHLRQILPHETFIPSRRHVLADLESIILKEVFADPIQRELSAFWRTRREEIDRVINRADVLGEELRQRRLPWVLCHADLHTWNVLLDREQQMWIVDWDETVLAPKERDLMFVMEGIGRDLVSSHETDCFLQGYGDAGIDRQALTYYRYAWAVQEMGAYAEDVFFAAHLSEEARVDSLGMFMSLFESGNIVAIATVSDGG